MELTELMLLRDKCRLFNEYMMNNTTLSENLLSAYQKSNELIELAFKSGKVNGLRSASRDIDEQIRNHLPEKIALDIKRIFKNQLNITVDTKHQRQIIKRILKKSRIENEKEYREVMDYVDEHHSDVTKAKEIDILNEILLRYESEAN